MSSKQGNCYLPILVVGGHVSLEEAFFAAAVMNTPPLHSAKPAAAVATAAVRQWLQLWYDTMGQTPLFRSILIYFSMYLLFHNFHLLAK